MKNSGKASRSCGRYRDLKWTPFSFRRKTVLILYCILLRQQCMDYSKGVVLQHKQYVSRILAIYDVAYLVRVLISLRNSCSKYRYMSVVMSDLGLTSYVSKLALQLLSNNMQAYTRVRTVGIIKTNTTIEFKRVVCLCSRDTIGSHLCRAELGEEKLTVGKIYAGLLIAENWKAFKTAAKSKGLVRRFDCRCIMWMLVLIVNLHSA